MNGQTYVVILDHVPISRKVIVATNCHAGSTRFNSPFETTITPSSSIGHRNPFKIMVSDATTHHDIVNISTGHKVTQTTFATSHHTNHSDPHPKEVLESRQASRIPKVSCSCGQRAIWWSHASKRCLTAHQNHYHTDERCCMSFKGKTIFPTNPLLF